MVLDGSNRDYRLPQQLPSGQVSWERIGAYPPWVSVRAPNVAPTHPVTTSFTGLDLLWPVALAATEPKGVQAMALAKTSATAWLQKPPFVMDPYRVPQEGPPKGSPLLGQFVLAYALTGSFPERFPSLFSPPSPSAPTRIIVVGDDDFLTDLMQFSDSLYNVLFTENAILWLSGNSDLLSIKTRASSETRLDRIQDPVERGRLMLAAELVNVVLVPLALLAFAVLRALRRRERGPS
jgi:ABC-type uncharacterized transport system involved in gliding motility auxiliary subunit